MATIKAKLKEIAETPEALAADRVWKQIESKLNFDGRYPLLNPAESMLRFGRLTNEEAEYLGRVMGWDKKFFNGVDWDAASSAFIAECLMLPEKRIMNTMSFAYPSPDRKPVFDAAEASASSSGDIEDFLGGDISFDELQQKYPAQAGTQKED